jgi:hypothetical protein
MIFLHESLQITERHGYYDKKCKFTGDMAVSVRHRQSGSGAALF